MTIAQTLARQTLRRAIEARQAYVMDCKRAGIGVNGTVEHHLCKYIEVAIQDFHNAGGTIDEVNELLS